MRTLLLPLLATIRSRIPLLFKSAQCDGHLGVTSPVDGDLPRTVTFHRPRFERRSLIGELIGEDKCGRGRSVWCVNGHRHLLVEVLDRLERAVAVSDQDLHIAQRVADEQVGLAIARQIGNRQAIGLKSDIDQGRRQEASPSVTAVDVETSGAEDGQSGLAVTAKVDRSNPPIPVAGVSRRSSGWKADRPRGLRSRRACSTPG